MVEVVTFFQKLGMTDLLIWLLSFAVIYGLLTLAKVPKSREARAIIGFVFGLLIILTAPTAAIAAFITKYASAMVLLAFGLLMLIIFFEVLGIKGKRSIFVEREGKRVKIGEEGVFPFLSEHPYLFSVALLIIAGFIFVAAGGLELIGIKIPAGINPVGAAFFVLMVIAVLWMVLSKE
jgi:hypothetical protein